jgi:hypothetical protein
MTCKQSAHLHHHLSHACCIRRARHEPLLRVADGVSRAVEQRQHLLPAVPYLLRRCGQHGGAIWLRLSGWDWLLGRWLCRRWRGGSRRWGLGGGRSRLLVDRQVVESAIQCPRVVLVTWSAIQEGEVGAVALPLGHHLHKADTCNIKQQPAELKAAINTRSQSISHLCEQGRQAATAYHFGLHMRPGYRCASAARDQRARLQKEEAVRLA